MIIMILIVLVLMCFPGIMPNQYLLVQGSEICLPSRPNELTEADIAIGFSTASDVEQEGIIVLSVNF